MTTEKINRDERRELRRLVDQTFSYLKHELYARESQVREVIKNRIMAEHAISLEEVQEAFQFAIGVAKSKGIAVEFHDAYSSKDDVSTVDDFDFEPIDLEKRIDIEMKALRDEAEMGHLSLSKEKLRIEREITLSALTSAEARAMVELIPDVDKLLPAVEVVEARALVTKS